MGRWKYTFKYVIKLILFPLRIFFAIIISLLNVPGILIYIVCAPLVIGVWLLYLVFKYIIHWKYNSGDDNNDDYIWKLVFCIYNHVITFLYVVFMFIYFETDIELGLVLISYLSPPVYLMAYLSLFHLSIPYPGGVWSLPRNLLLNKWSRLYWWKINDVFAVLLS